jgi:hypothetical protein
MHSYSITELAVCLKYGKHVSLEMRASRIVRLMKRVSNCKNDILVYGIKISSGYYFLRSYIDFLVGCIVCTLLFGTLNLIVVLLGY